MPSKKLQSIGDLSDVEAIEDIGGLDPGELPDTGKNHNPGRGIYRRELERYTKLTEDEKLTRLRDIWKEVAMGTATRAKAFVSTCSPKDFSNLQRLIAAGATAIDKAFPEKATPLAPKFIVNLFGSLGQRAAAIAMPPVPIIDVTAVEVPCPNSSTTQTMSLLPTKTET